MLADVIMISAVQLPTLVLCLSPLLLAACAAEAEMPDGGGNLVDAASQLPVDASVQRDGGRSHDDDAGTTGDSGASASDAGEEPVCTVRLESPELSCDRPETENFDLSLRVTFAGCSCSEARITLTHGGAPLQRSVESPGAEIDWTEANAWNLDDLLGAGTIEGPEITVTVACIGGDGGLLGELSSPVPIISRCI